ncbi:MAG: hypothetical protein AB1894_26955 [Chloroflexota bacterium]
MNLPEDSHSKPRLSTRPKAWKSPYKFYILLGGLALITALVVCVSKVFIPPPEAYLSPVRIVSTPSSSAPDDLKFAEQVRNLLEINGGCELPCWLGMRAGKTNLEDIFKKYELELDITPKKNSSTDYDLVLSDDVHGLRVLQSVYVEPAFSAGDDRITRFAANVIAWQRSSGSYYARVMRGFLPPSVLNKLGIPDQIWVEVYPYEPDLYTGKPYYELSLYYFEYGTHIIYRGDLVDRGNRLLLCPSRGVAFSIVQWWPESRVSTETLIEHPPVSGIPLEQAAGIDITKFYELFKESDSQACLETPAEMWK